VGDHGDTVFEVFDCGTQVGVLEVVEVIIYPAVFSVTDSVPVGKLFLLAPSVGFQFKVLPI